MVSQITGRRGNLTGSRLALRQRCDWQTWPLVRSLGVRCVADHFHGFEIDQVNVARAATSAGQQFIVRRRRRAVNVDGAVVKWLGDHCQVCRSDAAVASRKGGRGSSSKDVRLIVVAVVFVFGSMTLRVLESSLQIITRSLLFAPATLFVRGNDD
jgi:hypothetical protein